MAVVVQPRTSGAWRLLLTLTLAFSAAACARSSPPTEPDEALPRHAELVEEEVLRSVTGEPRETNASTERVAIVACASALDPLEPEVIRGFRLDVSTALEVETPQVIKVKALVAVHTVGPPEQMRAMLQGTGTVQRGTDRQADLELASKGAVRAALRRLESIVRRFSVDPATP